MIETDQKNVCNVIYKVNLKSRKILTTFTPLNQREIVTKCKLMWRKKELYLNRKREAKEAFAWSPRTIIDIP